MAQNAYTNAPSWRFRRGSLRYWLRVFCIAAMAFAQSPPPLVADARQTGDGFHLLRTFAQLSAWASAGAETRHDAQRASPDSPASIPSPFLRLYSMMAFSVLAYIPQWLFGDRKNDRMALRHGMAAGFTLSGIDHFVNMQARYLPMIPPFLAPYGAALVYGTGVTELAGAVGLVVPLAVYRWLGLPNLRPWAGIGIALMLAGLTVANVNVTLQASSGQEFAFAAWTYWLRLCFQPLFMLWALYAAGVIRKRQATSGV